MGITVQLTKRFYVQTKQKHHQINRRHAMMQTKRERPFLQQIQFQYMEQSDTLSLN